MDLDELKQKINNLQDALIAEVALTSGFGLVTGDVLLKQVAERHGISVFFVDANR